MELCKCGHAKCLHVNGVCPVGITAGIRCGCILFDPAPTQPDGDCYGCGLDRTHNEIDALRARLEQAEYKLHNASVCEIGAVNPNVASYCDHWEKRAEQAERASDEAQLRANKAEKNLQAVVNALCPQCGRSLPPDGDCYGCGLDRAQEQIAALRAREAEARWVIENDPCYSGYGGCSEHKFRRRAWLDGGKEAEG